MTWQVALAPDPERVQALPELNVPIVLLLVKVTEPLGVTVVPGEVSVTVAVHVVGLPWTMGDVQVTTVLLLRYATVAFWPDRCSPVGGERGFTRLPSTSVRITLVSLKPELPELPGFVRSAAKVTLVNAKI